LLDIHENDPAFPPDPELFVASQPRGAAYADPCLELTRPESARSYRNRVREIVRRLRRELKAEVDHAEGRIASGQGVARVLLSKDRRLSPLGRFIVAQRAGRPVLARRFVSEAGDQHRACPLYRDASKKFLPEGVYPVAESSKCFQLATPQRRPQPQVHLN
jgi:hypothetical protein